MIPERGGAGLGEPVTEGAQTGVDHAEGFDIGVPAVHVARVTPWPKRR